MKRMYKLLPVAIMVGLLATFTSCDSNPWYGDYDYYDYYGSWYDSYDWYNRPFNYGNDALNEEAQMLRGIWGGTLVAQYTENGQRVTQNLDVEFIFDQYNSKSLNGRGREYDYYSEGTDVLSFSWYIDPRTGDIYLEYDPNQYGKKRVMRLDAHSVSNGFYLDSSKFNGVMIGQNTDEVDEFNLERKTLAKAMTRGTKINSVPINSHAK